MCDFDNNLNAFGLKPKLVNLEMKLYVYVK